jgi:hypothetical protein
MPRAPLRPRRPLLAAVLALAAACAKEPEPPPRASVRWVPVYGALPKVFNYPGEVVVQARFRTPCAPYPLAAAAERRGESLFVRISGRPAMVPCPMQRAQDETYEVTVRPPKGQYRLTLVHHYEDGFWGDTTVFAGRAVVAQ